MTHAGTSQTSRSSHTYQRLCGRCGELRATCVVCIVTCDTARRQTPEPEQRILDGIPRSAARKGKQWPSLAGKMYAVLLKQMVIPAGPGGFLQLPHVSNLFPHACPCGTRDSRKLKDKRLSEASKPLLLQQRIEDCVKVSQPSLGKRR